jgi:hypothetical protein
MLPSFVLHLLLLAVLHQELNGNSHLVETIFVYVSPCIIKTFWYFRIRIGRCVNSLHSGEE